MLRLKAGISSLFHSGFLDCGIALSFRAAAFASRDPITHRGGHHQSQNRL